MTLVSDSNGATEPTLAGLLAALGITTDPAAPIGNGTLIALTKAIRDAVEAVGAQSYDGSGLATENTLRRLLTNLHFARDASDQMRVTGTLAAYLQWANQGTYVGWYGGTGVPTSMDAREEMKALARANAQQVRATRWSIT